VQELLLAIFVANAQCSSCPLYISLHEQRTKSNPGNNVVTQTNVHSRKLKKTTITPCKTPQLWLNRPLSAFVPLNVYCLTSILSPSVPTSPTIPAFPSPKCFKSQLLLKYVLGCKIISSSVAPHVPSSFTFLISFL